MKKKNPKDKIKRSLDSSSDLIKKAVKTKSISRKNKISNHNNNKIVTMPIDVEKDRYLILLKKKLINIIKPTLASIYAVKGQKDGYNLKYSLDKHRQLGPDKFEEWDRILGVRLKTAVYYKYDWQRGEYLSDEPIIIDLDDDEEIIDEETEEE